MIKLEVQDHCQDCPHFEAQVQAPDFYYTLDSIEPVRIGDTTVKCKHRDMCECVRQVMAKEIFTKLIEVTNNQQDKGKLSIGLLKAWAIEYDVEVEE